MLEFVIGRAKSGKTNLFFKKIENLAQSGEKVVLIVPLQFSFETEKTIYKKLGAKLARQVEVLSFDRLSEKIFTQYGKSEKPYADDVEKALLLQMAMEEVQDALAVYGKNINSQGFRTAVFNVISQLKNASVNCTDLERASTQIENAITNQKLEDISLIYTTYCALLQDKFADNLDSITRACELIQGENYFGDTHVFVDGFTNFMVNQYLMLEQILKSAKTTYVSLCMDDDFALERMDHFYGVRKTYNKVLTLAEKNAVEVMTTKVEKDDIYERNATLAHIEQNLFQTRIKGTKNWDAQAISVISAQNEYDEVEYVGATISNLVKQGYRYSDILVTARDLNTYKSIIQTEFDKYEIPAFISEGKSIENHPIIKFASIFLKLCSGNFKSELILSLLKTSLTPFDNRRVAELENYIFIWDIDGDDWKSEFTSHPNGFDTSIKVTEKDVKEKDEKLARFNEIREYVVGLVEQFSKLCDKKSATATQFSRALFAALKKGEIVTSLEAKIKWLVDNDEDVLANEYARIWNIYMSLLDKICYICQERDISIDKYATYMQIATEKYALDSPPQTLDQVLVGSCDAVRANQVKVVFVLGCNEEVFPLIAKESGLLSEKDKELLKEQDIDILTTTQESILQEQFIAYTTMTTPNERLYLTFRRSDLSGSEILKSSVIEQIKSMFDDFDIIAKEDIEMQYFCQNKKSAFLKLASNLQTNDKTIGAIASVLEHDSEYREKIESVLQAKKLPNYNMKDPEVAKKLFGQDLYISPSQIEKYQSCPFNYFCNYGLRLKTINKAKINPLTTGDIVHFVICEILSQTDFMSLDEKQVKDIIKQHLDNYVKDNMSNEDKRNSKFRYHYNRLSETLFKLVLQLKAEMKQSQFEPTDFELAISDDTDVKPLVIEIGDGATITLRGKIDRVDTYTRNGKKYIRIIDYKTGSKTLDLSDVYYGLNLQMLVYLFSIWKNGEGKYKDTVPAGVFYMPAGDPKASLERNYTDDEFDNACRKHYRMSGLALDDEGIICAMEKEIGGVFIPVSKNKDGNFSAKSPLVSLEQMGKLYNHIQKIVVKMGTNLHQGKIDAVPVIATNHNACEYCDYANICGITPVDKCREAVKLEKAEVFKVISQQQESEDGGEASE